MTGPNTAGRGSPLNGYRPQIGIMVGIFQLEKMDTFQLAVTLNHVQNI